MKISVKQLVILFLGLFLLKITVADTYREAERTKRRPASTIKTIKPVNKTASLRAYNP